MRIDRLSHRGGGLAVGYLVGSLLATFPMMLLLSRIAPGLSERLGPAFFFGTMALLCAGGGLLWGARLARTADPRHGRAWALAGAVGYGVSAPLAVFGLTEAETFLLRRAMEGTEYPMHLAFAGLFSGAILVVVGLVAALLGIAAHLGWRALRVAGISGGMAAGTFLLVDFAFDLAGWRVGAPGAEERFTMVVVLAVGLLFATYAAGAVLTQTLTAAVAALPQSGGPLRWPLAGGDPLHDRNRERIGSALHEIS